MFDVKDLKFTYPKNKDATIQGISFNIKKGDQVIIHHNIFRRWYDVKGKQRNSSQYFKEDLFFCKPDQ
ncbi:MAG: hypothetical protein ACPGCR_03890, partial [Acholeplasmataceae bacterium]